METDHELTRVVTSTDMVYDDILVKKEIDDSEEDKLCREDPTDMKEEIEVKEEYYLESEHCSCTEMKEDYDTYLEIKEEDIENVTPVSGNNNGGASQSSKENNPVQEEVDEVMHDLSMKINSESSHNEENLRNTSAKSRAGGKSRKISSIKEKKKRDKGLVADNSYEDDLDVEAAREFVKNMKSTFEKYSPHAVFNAAKTDLPIKMEMFLSEACDDDYEKKCHIILCANASGECKLRPAFIVSRDLNNMSSEEAKALPVWLAETETGELSDEVFIQWYSEEFIPQVSENLQKKKLALKALLLLDHPFSHLGDTLQMIDKNFRVVFLPPNTAPLIEPLTHNNMLPKLFPKYHLNTGTKKSSLSTGVSANDSSPPSVPKSTKISGPKAVRTYMRVPSQEQETNACITRTDSSQQKITKYFMKGK